jgi:HAE1 family hydrophobic/amphiphilic exporter-1
MRLVNFSIKKPVTVLVGVILVVMFGVIGLQRMPYQLSPTVTEPEITVTTTWRGATPYEIERDIIEEQEKVLKGIPNLVEMESDSLKDFFLLFDDVALYLVGGCSPPAGRNRNLRLCDGRA